MTGLKKLQNNGFVFYEDSQFYIFEKRDIGTVLFDQIKIKKDTKTFKCATYFLTDEEGYKEEAMTLNTTILRAILDFMIEISKKEKKDEQ